MTIDGQRHPTLDAAHAPEWAGQVLTLQPRKAKSIQAKLGCGGLP